MYHINWLWDIRIFFKPDRYIYTLFFLKKLINKKGTLVKTITSK